MVFLLVIEKKNRSLAYEIIGKSKYQNIMKDLKTDLDPFLLVKNSHEYFDYANFFQYYPQNITSSALPSSYILAIAFETLGIDRKFIDLALKIQETNGVNRSVFGLRLYGNKLDLEYYFFYPKKFPQNSFENISTLLTPYFKQPLIKKSIDVDAHLLSVNLKSDGIDGMNIYYPLIDPDKPVMSVDDTEYYFNSIDPIIQSTKLKVNSTELERENIYYSYFGAHQLYDIFERTYECCRKLFPNENPLLANQFLKFQYLYKDGIFIHPSAVTLKKGAVGFYFLDIGFDNLILFLKQHGYADEFIIRIQNEKQNLKHLHFDVGFDIILDKGNFIVRKAAFGGIF